MQWVDYRAIIGTVIAVLLPAVIAVLSPAHSPSPRQQTHYRGKPPLSSPITVGVTTGKFLLSLLLWEKHFANGQVQCNKYFCVLFVVEDDSSDDEMLCDDGWEECDEELLPESKVCCLFCSSFFSSPVDVLLHCKTEHSFDIARVKAMQQLESISYIKLINFIRQTVSTVWLQLFLFHWSLHF